MKAISIKNLTKTYADGTIALKGINLDVEVGDFFALLGANGAGKTTIIGILTGLVNKTSGSAKIFDYDIKTHSTESRKVMGVVPQEMNFNLFEQVQDIIINQAGYFGIERKTAIKETDYLLKELHLWEKRKTQSKMLSGGMKRRLMIARALVNKPRLLILDEPTAGVDVELRHSMWTFLNKLNKQGTTILLTTHYLEEVERLCKGAAIIREGEIITNDRVRNLVRFIDKETFVVHVRKITDLDDLSSFNPLKIDDATFEVDLSKTESLNDFLARLSRLGMVVNDLRPKGNRIERLFLEILKK